MMRSLCQVLVEFNDFDSVKASQLSFIFTYSQQNLGLFACAYLVLLPDWAFLLSLSLAFHLLPGSKSNTAERGWEQRRPS